jgi:hypothetical protein
MVWTKIEAEGCIVTGRRPITPSSIFISTPMADIVFILCPKRKGRHWGRCPPFNRGKRKGVKVVITFPNLSSSWRCLSVM